MTKEDSNLTKTEKKAIIYLRVFAGYPFIEDKIKRYNTSSEKIS